ncbi:MAG: type I restriction endonuclease [Vicinamibacteria bacterium]
MSPHAFTEDQLVEQPAVGLFAELGWETVSASEEVFGAGGTLQRETKGDVVLVSRLRAALERLNPGLPPEAISAAIDELSRDRLAMGLAAANREVYSLLKEGIKVSVPDKEHGGQKAERLRVIDWENSGGNDFLLVRRPAPELSTEERAEVKKVARDLLARLKLLLVLNWRGKSSARSQLKLAIQDVLDGGLPRAYDKPLYEQKCEAIFEHVYESYPERDSGVYATPALARTAG